MLNFDYDDSAGESRAEYKGLTIRAVRDDSPENPWNDCDGFAPLLWHALGNREAVEHGKADLESPLQSLSDGMISRHWKRLASIVELDADQVTAELKDNQKDYGGRLVEYRREALQEALSDMKTAWPVDYFDALESLWGLAGCAVLGFQSDGYSQGDSALGLLVATPAWREAMGIPAKRPLADDLEGQRKVFSAWLWGDVYGFVIESAGEQLDSCWGYYGDDFAESGLADAAIESADCILANAAKRKGEKLKELIRNRVPLALRPSILADAAALESL